MWIVRALEKRSKNLPVFYKQFRVEKELERCVMDISALGVFHIKINGVDIDEYFMPGWTNYNKYVHLCSYDLTKYLQKENLLEITLADGWYSGRLGYTKKARVYGNVKALFAELAFTYKDGTEEKIVTDETWRVGTSNIVKSSFFDGETIDFRTRAQKVGKLPFATKYEYTTRFERYNFEPTVKIDELTPSVLYQKDNVTVLDFKQNFAGFLTFDVEGEKDAEIIIKHSEILNEDGTPYYENLRSVLATDKVICSGKKETFLPTFTFHGFRYAEIEIKGDARISNIKGEIGRAHV